jgi:hypothetical protein
VGRRNSAIRRARIVAVIVATGCGGVDALGPSSSGTSGACQVGAGLDGVAYDIGKSRFAFGSTPVRDDQSGSIRWVGAHGVLAIEPTGQVTGAINSDAPERSLADWSDDPDALSSHVVAYFVSLGVEPCQIARSNVLGGSSRTVALARGFETIPVIESIAFSDMRISDQTTTEGFYWPSLSAEVAAAARAFRDRLSEPAALAAYKAKLPADVQGEGIVVIHHTSGLSTDPFAAAALYDVAPPPQAGSYLPPRSYDADGNEVKRRW